MATTPQTNTDLAAMAQALLACDDIVVCGHVSPDGDCLGSQLALAAALRQAGKRVSCVLAKDDPVDRNLLFLPGIEDLVPAADFDGAVSAFVGVDVPTRERIGQAACELLDRADVSFTLDHHAADEAMADFVYVDPDAASTTTLVWKLAALLGARRAGDVALCCYTGLVTDTGRFQYQNTNVDAFVCAQEMVEAGLDASLVSREVFQNRSLPSLRLEALAVDRLRLQNDGQTVTSWLTLDDFAREGAIKADAEPLIDALRAVSGVRVACLLREQEDCVRGSVRAKDDTDVAAVARRLGGGGHKAAAGFTLQMPLEDAMALVEEALAEAVSGE